MNVDEVSLSALDYPFNRREKRVLAQVKNAPPLARRIVFVLLSEHRDYHGYCTVCGDNVAFPCHTVSVVIDTILEEEDA